VPAIKLDNENIGGHLTPLQTDNEIHSAAHRHTITPISHEL